MVVKADPDAAMPESSPHLSKKSKIESINTPTSSKTKVEAIEESPPAKLETNDSAIKFWRELKDISDDNDAADFIQEQTRADPSLLLTKSEDGVSLTEYLCSLDRSPCVRDVLDEVIEKKVPVTEECYNIILEARDSDNISPDMLKSLLQSGQLPKEIHGEKPLDAIFDALENDGNNDWFEEEPDEFIREAFGMDGDSFKLEVSEGVIKTASCEVKEGVTHEAGGCFEKWFRQATKGLELSETVVNDKKRKLPN